MSSVSPGRRPDLVVVVVVVMVVVVVVLVLVVVMMVVAMMVVLAMVVILNPSFWCKYGDENHKNSILAVLYV